MSLKYSKCACRKCCIACERKPCWLTPAEAAALETAHPGMTVVDTSAVFRGRTVRVTRMRIVGETPGGEYFGAVGPCVFYNAGRCTLHYTNLKPQEGRLNSHELSLQQSAELRARVVMEWVR